MRNRLLFDEGSKGFFLLFLISQLFLTNGIILFVGMLIFFTLFYQLQQPYKPSVFTIILIFHFVQIAATVWLSNNLGRDINFRSDNTTNAIIVSYIGLVCVFLPIIYYQNKIPKLSLEKLKEHANLLSIEKTFKIYVIGFFVMNVFDAVAFIVPSFTQILLGTVNVKWFLFLLFAFQSILKNRMRKELYIFCAVEFVLGFVSFFSDFKTIIFFLVILSLTLLSFFRFNKLMFGVIIGIVVIYGAIFYTGIKGDYRSFLNKGTKTQKVQVSATEALSKLVELSGGMSETVFTKSTDNFLNRLQYTFHLAKTMDRVPSVIPYQDGKNLGSTFEFILVPRFINPDKGVYDASVRASKYTGYEYAGIKDGTSISLGYFADCYIDFGYVGMFVPLLILGFIFGSTYFYFVKNSSKNYIFNFAVVGAIYFQFYAFESDSIYLVGKLYVNLVIFLLLKIFFFSKLIAYLNVPVKTIEKS